MLTIAVRAARAGGNVIMRKFERVGTLAIATRQRSDFVLEIDRQAEAKIVETLRQSYPGHAILAEESGLSGDSKYLWIIDSLGGSINYLNGFPIFAVSIALQSAGELQQAVVYDPVSQELYTASRGRGAWLDNRRLRVSARRSLEDSLLGMGFPHLNTRGIDHHLGLLRDFLLHTNSIRHSGVAALDLAYVAAGRLDGLWETGLGTRDIAAGGLIIREAGGLMGDFSGGENWLRSGQVVAANPRVFHAMLQVIKPHLGNFKTP